MHLPACLCTKAAYEVLLSARPYRSPNVGCMPFGLDRNIDRSWHGSLQKSGALLLYYTILILILMLILYTIYYTILYHTMLYYTILYYTILYYTILYYTILYYTILILYLYYTLYTKHYILYTIYYTILYYTVLYYIVLYYTILYYTILYYTLYYTYTCTILILTLYYTILYYTILYYRPQIVGLSFQGHSQKGPPIYGSPRRPAKRSKPGWPHQRPVNELGSLLMVLYDRIHNIVGYNMIQYDLT